MRLFSQAKGSVNGNALTLLPDSDLVGHLVRPVLAIFPATGHYYHHKGVRVTRGRSTVHTRCLKRRGGCVDESGLLKFLTRTRTLIGSCFALLGTSSGLS